MAVTVVTYERGTTYVKDDVAHDGEICHGLVGELSVGGRLFDTLERFRPAGTKKGDFIHLRAGDYPRGVMYWWKPDKQDPDKPNPGKRVLNPWVPSPYHNILVHYGKQPYWFEGCIGPGFLGLEGGSSTLAYSAESMEIIFELCGGTPGNKGGWTASSPRVLFRVANAFPDRGRLTAHAG